MKALNLQALNHPVNKKSIYIGLISTSYSSRARREHRKKRQKKTCEPVKVAGFIELLRMMLDNKMVPEVGIEPTRARGPLDFESSASTSFTTPAGHRY